MRDSWPALRNQYMAALRDYVASPDEAILARAYALGRQVVGDEHAMLDLVGSYHQELASLVRAAPGPDQCERTIELAQAFFSESLSSAAMAQRGFLETAARLSDLHGLLEVQRAISGAAQSAQVAQRLVTHAGRSLNAGACIVLLLRPNGGWEQFATTEGEEQAAPAPVSPEQDLIARALETNGPIIVDARQSEHGGDTEGQRGRSQLAVALRSGDQVFGVLVFQAAGPGTFGPSNVALAQLIAEYAAQALARAGLLEEIQQQNTALETANRQLQMINQELEAFSYSVSHDLRAPLRAIAGFSQLVLEEYGDRLDEQGKEYLKELIEAGRDMGQLIDALLRLSRVSRTEMRWELVDLGTLARTITAALARREPERDVTVTIAEDLVAQGDEPLLRIALENLLGNAWKFSRHTGAARIEVDAVVSEGQRAYVVRDNGAGFDMAYAQQLFGAFRRLHSAREFEGIGIGLATVQRIINRHGGRIWAQGRVGDGAAFYFTLVNALSTGGETAAPAVGDD